MSIYFARQKGSPPAIVDSDGGKLAETWIEPCQFPRDANPFFIFVLIPSASFVLPFPISRYVNRD